MLFRSVPIDGTSRAKYRIIDSIINRIRFSAFNVDERSMAKFVKKIEAFRPSYFYGYVNTIKDFTQYCEKNNINLNQMGLKAIVTTSEPLFKETREYLEGVFNCNVINDYGSGEVGPIAYDCPEGGFHLMADNLYIEIINEKGTHAREGEKGEVVVTELNNYSLPLIRYNLKDIAEVTDQKCSCGRGLPLIKQITGRDRDVLIAPSGKKVHGAYLNQIAQEGKEKGYGIKQYQVIQQQKDYIIVKIVKDSGYSQKTDRFIEDKMKEVMGDNVKISIEIVDKIQREKSGKLRVVKCEIAT